MRRTTARIALPLALVMLAACAPSSEESPMVRLQVPDDPTVTFKVWIRCGSQDDPVGKEGLAWLTGRLIEEGATEVNAYDKILEALYPMAAGYGVSVDREMTVMTGRVHRDNVERYLELYGEALLQPAFRSEDFERVRSDAINDLKNTLRYQADEDLGKVALEGFVFEGTRYAHPPEGSVSALEALTVDDVREFYRVHYSRANAVAAIGGGFDDGLAQRFDGLVDRLPEGVPDTVPPPDPAPIDRSEVLLVSREDADASISFGFPIDVRRGDRDFYALWIANSWLGEHRNSSSHLYQVIRETRGMNYGDYSYIEAFPGGGGRQFPPSHVARRAQLFQVWIRTLPNEQAHFALRAAVHELHDLVDGGMTEEEFELTRSFLRSYVLHFADTTAARLGYAVDDRFYGVEDPGHLVRFKEAMESLTLGEANAAIRKHLRADRMKIAIVTGRAGELAAALGADAPSPMIYESPKSDELLADDKVISTWPLHIDPEAIRIVPVEEMFR